MLPLRACIVRRNQAPVLATEPDLGGNRSFDSFPSALGIDQYEAHPKGRHLQGPLFQEDVLADPAWRPQNLWWHAALALG